MDNMNTDSLCKATQVISRAHTHSPQNGENLGQSHCRQGAESLDYKDSHKLKSTRTELPINRWANKLNRWLSIQEKKIRKRHK